MDLNGKKLDNDQQTSLRKKDEALTSSHWVKKLKTKNNSIKSTNIKQ